MPLFLRFIVVAVLSYLAGSTVTPFLWAPILAQQSQQILSPFAVLSAAILTFSVALAIREWKRK